MNNGGVEGGQGGVVGQQYGPGEGVFPCVKLRGLPFQAGEEDVVGFLGVTPIDIVFVYQGGRPSGEAFVVLNSIEHVELALGKHQEYIGKRYVEVFRCRKFEYYKAIVQLLNERDGHHMYEPGMQAPGYYREGPGVGMGGHDDGQGDYQGYNQFYGPQGYGGGHMGPQMGMGPGPYGRGGGNYAGASGAGAGGGGGGGPHRRAHTGIVKMRGLPFTSREEDIQRWFEDPNLGLSERIPIANIHMAYKRGKPAGIAYVEFDNPEQAESAMRKNNQMMGMRYIELFMANRQEMDRDLDERF